MTSLWLDRAARRTEDGSTYPASDFKPGVSYDTVVVGAGLTGLVTGLLLARAGQHVAIVEAHHVGAVNTGNTTAKLSLLQGTKYSEMLKHTSLRVAKAYVEGNREGFEWLLRYLDDHDVPYQRRDAYTYAGTPDGVGAVDDEFAAAWRVGLPVEKVRDLDVAFPVRAAVRLRNQAQFDPLQVLAALAADFRARGGTLVEGVRVTGVSALRPGRGAPCVVRTRAGEVRATRVVLATGIPILDRGLYFAKVTHGRSYGLAFRVPPGALPEDFGMYLSVDAPKRTLRSIPVVPEDGLPEGEGELLLVGGNGHKVAHHPHPRDLVADIEVWTGSYFPGAQRTHAWSAQDYRSANLVPFVGWMPRTAGRVFLATGFDKWGMTNAVSAAIRLSGELLGGHIPWARTLGRRVTRPRSVLYGARFNAEVARDLTAGWAKALATEEVAAPAEGQGIVHRVDGRPVATCRVNGTTTSVSAVCSHLRGIVRWNDQELTWDCPLHASRYSHDGTRIEGPTKGDLAPL
ncbi:FAD-dependent oxidoreductase [Naasia sp. SYSU D00948]|uniref:FAD-dependent oxidoreductase n=1 Tax=Naasia sp. SYSU D00948 TaxID=2817379 RepID=UPI001B311067|nr:FAD-dependent oxidoreductase [Naasia sp. SYSU D00948]